MTKKLSESEITTARTGRRSAMLMIGALVTAASAEACSTGCSDSDTGPTRDPAHAGIHCRSCSDSDTSSACTDYDTGTTADAVGHGTHCVADGAGHGRHC